jgi:hypothetical protein
MAHPIAVNDSGRRTGGISPRRLWRSRPGYLRNTGARVARARATDRLARVGSLLILLGRGQAVETHVENVLRKLGFTSRAQIAVWISERARDRSGQGLDTRAYRLDWPPGVRLFEVDQPDVLGFKDQVLDGHGAVAACARYTVGVNLQDDWPAALRQAGFDPSALTGWLVEGLLMYLPVEAETQLYAAIHDLSAPGSRLFVERPDPDILMRSQKVDAMRQVGVDVSELLQSGARPSAVGWLTDHGWSATEQASTAVAQRYRRDLAQPVTSNAPEQVMKMAEHMAFLSARRAG